jgi:hypothetical protein
MKDRARRLAKGTAEVVSGIADSLAVHVPQRRTAKANAEALARARRSKLSV